MNACCDNLRIGFLKTGWLLPYFLNYRKRISQSFIEVRLYSDLNVWLSNHLIFISNLNKSFWFIGKDNKSFTHRIIWFYLAKVFGYRLTYSSKIKSLYATVHLVGCLCRVSVFLAFLTIVICSYYSSKIPLRQLFTTRITRYNIFKFFSV